MVAKAVSNLAKSRHFAYSASPILGKSDFHDKTFLVSQRTLVNKLPIFLNFSMGKAFFKSAVVTYFSSFMENLSQCVVCIGFIGEGEERMTVYTLVLYPNSLKW